MRLYNVIFFFFFNFVKDYIQLVYYFTSVYIKIDLLLYWKAVVLGMKSLVEVSMSQFMLSY
jgi:hypothetical protein